MVTGNTPTHIGKYEILSTLGRGGMGVVYKARDPIIDRIVAVKTILVNADPGEDDDLAERLQMEARSAGRLHHPNIVTVFDFGQEGDLSYIVMEYVEGINLARLIDERRAVGLDAKVGILIQIADGLGFAHEHGVTHRDMKPSNVCVTARGTAKILDFGLARFDSTRLTKTGFMAGTIAYMSPERLGGAAGLHDDIFALGAIAYELLTYQRAFPGATPPEIISKIIEPAPPVSPSQIALVPSELDAIVLKALAKDIDDRYDTAAAMADDLRHFMRSEAMQAYLDDEQRKTVDRAMSEFVDPSPTGHAYAGPRNKRTILAEPAPAGTATHLEPTPTAIARDVRSSGPQTEPDTVVASAPTQIFAEPPRRRKSWLAVAAVAIILAGAGVFVFTRPGHPVPTPQKKVAPAPQNPAAPDPRVEQSELQLATAQSMSDELARRPLTADEMMRFSEAKGRISLAEKKLNAKDYDASARLIADGIAELRAVMNATEKRQQTETGGAVEVPLKPNRRTITPHTTVVASARPMPQPQPAIEPSRPASPVPQPVIEPRPVPVPEPQPAQPSPQPRAEPPEKEIGAFMRQLSAAYQNKDVAFFREHALHFSDQLANAIRNSPSTRVELQIARIDVQDPQHASVHVKRTDWFPDASTPPATQSLVYRLERNAGGWQLATIARE